MHFWSPEIDPDHPLACTHPERYVLRRLSNGCYLAIDPVHQSLMDVEAPDRAHGLHTHEAALRAATELRKLGLAAVDVLKLE